MNNQIHPSAQPRAGGQEKFRDSMLDEFSKAEKYFKSQKMGAQVVAPDAELFKKKEDMEKLTSSQINKGEDRLKFKHPLKSTSIFSVLPYLKPIGKCMSLCGCVESQEERNEKKKKNKKKKDRYNRFYYLQSQAKKLQKSQGGRDPVKLRALMNQIDEGAGEDLTRSVNLNLTEQDEISDESEEVDELMEMYNKMLEADEANINLKRSKANKAEQAAKKTKSDNPFLSYGAGIQNYFVLQERLIKLFCILSILAIPQILIYRFFDGYNYTKGEGNYAGNSFGGMGFSGYSCGTNFIDWSQETTDLILQCQGTTRIRDVLQSGIVDVNQSGEDNTLKEFNRCFYDRPINYLKIPVMREWDDELITKDTLSRCNGLQACKVSVKNTDLNVATELQTYDQKVFIQVACEQDEEMVFLKNVMGLCASVLGLLIILVYRNTLTVYYKTNIVNDKIFDSQLITLGDYSVQGKISGDQWQEFLSKMGGEQEHAVLKFEVYLTEMIQNWLMKEDANQQADQSTYQVADIQLAFDNDGVHSLLAKRADALKSGKFETAKEYEAKLTEYKNENLDALYQPKNFFCTFHMEYAYHKAIELCTMPLLGQDITIKQAVEPTDIIWENRHFRKTERRIRWVIALIIMVSLAFLGFMAIIWLLKHKLLIQYMKSPPGIECDNVIRNFQDSLQQFAYREELEWQNVDPLEYNLNRITSRNGALTCFCDFQSKGGSNSKRLYEVKDSTGEVVLYPICEKFNNDTSSLSVVGGVAQLTSLFVVVINQILTQVFIRLIKLTKENKHTKEAVSTFKSILVVTFFNYGVLYLIAPWNFSEQGMQDGDFFSGIYTDFTPQWYLDIGTLVAGTAVINMVSPIASFLASATLRFLKRVFDQGTCCPCNKRNTKAKSVWAFERLYSGPEFVVHYRLAFIVNIIYVAFWFGPGMPILFPIALAGLIVTYSSERLRMAYSYTKPPMYDSRLSQSTLSALRWAPTLYALQAAWTWSNQQVFRNTVSAIKDFSLYPLNDHLISQSFTQITPATIFVIYIIFGLLYWIVGIVYQCGCKKDSAKVEVEDLVIIEQLEPFYSMLKNKDREFWFREETVSRERIALKRMSNKNFTQLILAKPNLNNRRLRSVHNYDILANPIYSDRFHYIPAAYPQRSEYIISQFEDPWMRNYSSDIVRLACDLPYLPKSVARELNFNEEAMFRMFLKLRRETVGNDIMMTQQDQSENGHNDSQVPLAKQ